MILIIIGFLALFIFGFINFPPGQIIGLIIFVIGIVIKWSSRGNSSGVKYNGSSGSSSYTRVENTGKYMAELVISGHSCKDCDNYNCPFDGGYKKPVVSGINICQKWSKK